MTNPVSDPGQVPADDIPAAAALAAVAELPQGTPGLAGPGAGDQTAPPAPAAAPGSPGLDRKGNTWDPAIHETPARLNCEGKWAKLRGNAARRAKGLAFTGSSTVAGKVGEAPPPPAAAAAPAEASFLNLDAPPPSGQVLTAEVMAPAARMPEDYTSTAAGIVLGLFGLCRILMGKAWKPDPEESKAWNEAMKRTLAHYQAPVLGPAVELIPLAITTAAKRSEDQETREKVGRFAGWLGRLLGRRQVVRNAPPEDARPTPPPPPSPMAGASPRVEY